MVFTKLKKQGQSGPGILIMLAIIVIGILGVILLAKVGVFTKLSYVEDCESQGGKVVPRGICPDDYISKPDPKDSTRECCYIGNDCLYTDGREKNEGKCDCNKNNKLDDPEDCGKDGGYCFDGKCFQYKKWRFFWFLLMLNSLTIF